MNTDRAITRSAEDTLERASFAAAVAKSLIKHTDKECLVAAIQGSWGSGKSSILSMVVERLEKDVKPSPLIVQFNPWYFTDDSFLIQRFFDTLSKAINRPNTSEELKNASKYLELLSRITEPAMYIPKVGMFAKIFSSLLKKGAKVIRSSAEVMKQDIAATKQQINKALAGQSRRIYVVIDDIDRLTADEIRQMFRLVRSLADFNNVTYLLAFDRIATTAALDALQPGKGAEFLEKIVQINYLVPHLTTDVARRAIERKFVDMLGPYELKDSEGRYGLLCHHGLYSLFRTPRDMKRFLNTFAFNWERLNREVDAIDLFALTALQVFCTDVFEAIANNMDLFCFSWRTEISLSAVPQKRKAQEQEIVDEFNSILDLSSNVQRPIVSEILKATFPIFTSRILGIPTQSCSDHGLLVEKRVATESNFMRMFRFGLVAAEITSSELEELYHSLRDGEEFRSLLNALIEKGKSTDVADRLTAFLSLNSEFRGIDLEGCVLSLLVIGAQCNDVNQACVEIERIIRHLLKHEPDPVKRGDAMLKCIAATQRPSFLLSHLVHKAISQHEGKDSVNPRDRLVDEIYLAKIKAEMNHSFSTWHQSGAIRLDENIFEHMYAWNRCDQEISLKDKFKNYVSNDADLIAFLNIWSRRNFKRESIFDLIERGAFETRIRLIAQNGVHGEQLASSDRALINGWISDLEKSTGDRDKNGSQ